MSAINLDRSAQQPRCAKASTRIRADRILHAANTATVSHMTACTSFSGVRPMHHHPFERRRCPRTAVTHIAPASPRQRRGGCRRSDGRSGRTSGRRRGQRLRCCRGARRRDHRHRGAQRDRARRLLRPRHTGHPGRAGHGEHEARRPIRSSGQRRARQRPRSDSAPLFEDPAIGGMDARFVQADVSVCLGIVKSLTLLVDGFAPNTSICRHVRSGRGRSRWPHQRWR